MKSNTYPVPTRKFAYVMLMLPYVSEAQSRVTITTCARTTNAQKQGDAQKPDLKVTRKGLTSNLLGHLWCAKHWPWRKLEKWRTERSDTVNVAKYKHLPKSKVRKLQTKGRRGQAWWLVTNIGWQMRPNYMSLYHYRKKTAVHRSINDLVIS